MSTTDPHDSLEEDLFAPSGPMPDTPTEGFVLCEFDGVTIAVPQSDLVTIEHGNELSAPLPGEPVIGWFNSPQGPWPVHALDQRLRALTEQPATGAYLVFVRSQPWPSGLLCERVRIVRASSELTIQPLPAVLRDPASPIGGIARLDKRTVAWILDEGRLAAHLAAVTSNDEWNNERWHE